MKITQSWKRNNPTTDGYSLTITYVYSSKHLHEIEEIEKKLPLGMLIMDTDKSERMYPLEQEAVEPIPPTDELDLWRCGNCNHQLFRCTHQRYCEMCGQEVKWE